MRECADKQCLIALEPKCVASHAHIARWTVEGKPIGEEWFVHPGAAGACAVTVVFDATADGWGDCSLMVRECHSIAAASGQAHDPLGCTQREGRTSPARALICRRKSRPKVLGKEYRTASIWSRGAWIQIERRKSRPEVVGFQI